MKWRMVRGAESEGVIEGKENTSMYRALVGKSEGET
jgi:hypothetical protein